MKPSAEREQVFADMLAGDEQDTLAPVRLIAVEALIRNYRQFHQGLDALKEAALHDRSNAVKRRASGFLKSIGVSLTKAVEDADASSSGLEAAMK